MQLISELNQWQRNHQSHVVLLAVGNWFAITLAIVIGMLIVALSGSLIACVAIGMSVALVVITIAFVRASLLVIMGYVSHVCVLALLRRSIRSITSCRDRMAAPMMRATCNASVPRATTKNLQVSDAGDRGRVKSLQPFSLGPDAPPNFARVSFLVGGGINVIPLAQA